MRDLEPQKDVKGGNYIGSGKSRLPAINISQIIPVLLAFIISGLIWEIRAQAIQDQKIEVIAANQRQVMNDLRAVISEVESSTTPLSKRVEVMDQRLLSATDRILKLETKVDNFRELEDQRHKQDHP